MKKTLLTVLMSSSVIFLSACGSDDNDSVFNGPNNGIPVNNIQNPVVGIPITYIDKDEATNTLLNSVSSQSTLMTYKMLGVDNKEVMATALVFVPNKPAPANGWPIVAWAHGTTGVADQCAPSQQGLKGTQDLLEKLLAAGYVVVAPDYEGLGEPSGKEVHPFLNLKSEAYSITDAVVATRNYLDKQGKKTAPQWVTVGHSQGGQAALGAAQYASRAKLDYKGTIAIAPASNLDTIFDFGTQYAQTPLPPADKIGIYASLNTYAALIVAGMQSQPNPATYTQVFQPEAAITAADATTICATPLGGKFAGEMGAVYQANPLLTGYLTQTDFMKVPMVATFINKTAQPLTVKVTTPIKIYQGQLDTTVPKVATDKLVKSARSNGTVIEDKNYRIGLWDHTSAYTSNIDNIVNDVKEMMPIPAP
ncbi:alpha/beta fold hydrolase [Acinetobacter sp. ANC 4779]|uniref:alpha/beta fold hydrolase n=1 Tax=Acinetobacter sp. ANC 4779 TaxID=2529848 RepID=UPI00103BF29F|nr:alpha/beta fold hydrolase [Acinetobacter sp. ANC 4779]TCB52405.1 alpha/beta fold hydrolase [Acinetobacter sp. ANC 4779]